jgi:hypothetical protein
MGGAGMVPNIGQRSHLPCDLVSLLKTGQGLP